VIEKEKITKAKEKRCLSRWWFLLRWWRVLNHSQIVSNIAPIAMHANRLDVDGLMMSKKKKKKKRNAADESEIKIGVRLAQEMTLVKDVNHQIANQTAKVLQ
jgi:hypothetical protein